MYTAYKNYAFQALIVQDGTKLRLLRKEIIDRLEKNRLFLRLGEEILRKDARCFALRHKVFCV